MHAPYRFGTALQIPYEEALRKVKAALQAEGFGVLTDIDLQATMREKLGAELEPYHILGVCNPPLAHRALTRDLGIGLLLPCHVVVRAEGEHSRVDIADPEAMLGMTGNDRLQDIAQEAKQRLARVIVALRDMQA